ncbi:hypothetical protein N657DRAFT_629957 [Parathielavia appendiculata]|uniref:PinX1-related protein 1 n=1 Tax=Parathielavia appendiculata TaxID=2587402 RepID=A0AAN6UCB5_9PEZI|nr:hypothetical protein N657DRAFT_629957 [Parathielavia appendiculata]
MGLAAAKNKRKLGNDPNNTKWSRNTDSFGHKILRAQGWQPGDYLGAKDVAHAEWHTEANSAHIRVVLKDDTLGLGAKRNNGDECTGLDAFQHLLGRLNGKSDDTLETERKAREDLKRSLYVEKKFGTIRFVKGGWLVGDQVKDSPDEGAVDPQNESDSEAPKSAAEVAEATEIAPTKPNKGEADEDDARKDDKKRTQEKKSKKRKAESEAEADGESAKEKKDKKSKKRRAEAEEGDGEASSTSRRSKKRKDGVKVIEEFAQSPSAAVSEAGGVPDHSDCAAETGKAKKEKKDKKRDKTDKKERKEKKRRKESALETATPTSAESNLTTPAGSGYSTPVPAGSSRYLARSRFIAQKKMAFADSAALNQIFMIKS